MSKAEDIDDVLGESTSKPAKGKRAAKEAPAAKKAAGKKAVKAAPAPAAKKAPAKKAVKAEAAERPAKEPIVWEEGEREALIKRIPKLVSKPINSRDLAAKLEVPTRKLRTVLYSMAKGANPVLSLELGASKVLGMTVSKL